MTDAREPQQSDGRTADDAAPRPSRAVTPRRRAGPALLVTTLRRRRWPFLGVLAAAILIAGLIAAARVPRYTATAEVVLDTSGGAARAAPDDAATRARAETELRILRSREMARAVTTALSLDRDPAFVRDMAGGGSLLGRLFGGGTAMPAVTGMERQRRVIDRLAEGLDAQPLAGTYSLAIGYTAADPDLAARIANAFAREYGAGRLAARDATPAALDRPGARLISEAEPPLAPAAPRPLLIVAIGAALGAVLGAALAVLLEWRFAGLTSTSDVEERLGLIHLGSVPVLESVVPGGGAPLDSVVSAPMSAFAEAFRSVFMTIRHVGGRGTQVIAITSTLPNEGKTTIAACLARSVALSRESVVLIDCDARRRDTSALFTGAAPRPGLAQVLNYEATLDEALIRDEASGAWILPLTGPPADLSELLGGQAMAALIEDLRRRFKRILIDTAPILPISGTRALTTMADLVVIVVRWRATPDRAVKAALRLLPERDVRIGGVVLSQIDMRETGKYGRDDPNFYYKQYSKYYT